LATLKRYSDVRLAAVLFVAGWTLFWASALNLIAFVPLWLALACIIAGLLVLTLSSRRAAPAPKTVPLAEQPAKP
jgi:predicted membrane protein